MRIGYACITVGVPYTGLKSCILKNASEEKLASLIAYNLNSLENIIDYNIENGIKLFRISSDLIPFGSSPVNSIPWWEMFASQLAAIGRKIMNSGMRVSMHPGQYTVLNSPSPDVVARAKEDLIYHARVLDSLGLDEAHKIVLHIGGAYNDKAEATERFIAQYDELTSLVKQRLVIENDDKCYTICDVLKIGKQLHIPVIYDNLHHQLNLCEGGSDADWILKCKTTWTSKDGPQKIHYAQQDGEKKPGSHSATIHINDFMRFYEALGRQDIDIMLETKDKNLSAIKCSNCISPPNLRALEVEWSRYKYSVLEHSPADYVEVRKLMANRNDCTALNFYTIVETALLSPINIGNSTNAAQHVWGYFKDDATPKEKEDFAEKLKAYQQGKLTLSALKGFLMQMAIKYQLAYLLNAYYFSE